MAGRPEKFSALRAYLQQRAKEYRETGEFPETSKDWFEMKFYKIEELGVPLPASAYKHHAWWSNRNYKRPWSRTNLMIEGLDMSEKKLRFRYNPLGRISPEGTARQDEKKDEKKKASQIAFEQTKEKLRKRDALISSPSKPLSHAGMSENTRPYSAANKQEASDAPTRCRHPLYGALKGHIRLVAGTDLTKPSDPEWGEHIEHIWGKDDKK